MVPQRSAPYMSCLRKIMFDVKHCSGDIEETHNGTSTVRRDAATH